MVWGYISFYGRGELVFLEGNVNQNTYIKYKGMLINPSFFKKIGPPLIKQKVF